MNFHKNFAAFFGRMFLAALFFFYGGRQILNFSETVRLLAGSGIQAPSFFAVVAILFQLAGAVFLFLGFKTQLGAWLLLAVWVPGLWVLWNGLNGWDNQMTFLKNLAVCGGVLMVLAAGPGSWSMEGGGGGGRSKGE